MQDIGALDGLARSGLTKGDLLVFNGSSWVRAPVGADAQVIVADSTQTTGVKYGDILPLLTPLTQVFRSLSLRTHPDNDKAPNQVALLGLGEVIMSDGFRYTAPTVPLLADITIAGAAGLDTGSRTASTWYEIYLIGKSSTKLVADLRLLLHRAKDYFNDSGQSFTTADDAARALRLSTATATDLLAQGFKTPSAGAPGKIEFVDVKLIRAGAVSGNIWLEIRSDNAGNPSTTVLATSDKLDASKVSTTAQTIRFPFRTPFTTADQITQYHLVLNADYTRSDTVVISWRGVLAGGYANGSAKQFDGTTWSAATGVGAFIFTLNTTRNDLAVTMPAGYDQRALLSYVFNDAGNLLKRFIARDRRIQPIQSSIIGSTASTIPVLMSLSALAPPVPVSVQIGVLNTNATAAHSVVGPVPDGFGSILTISSLGGTSGFVTMAAGALGQTEWGLTAEIETQFQGIYVFVGAGTGEFLLKSYQW